MKATSLVVAAVLPLTLALACASGSTDPDLDSQPDAGEPAATDAGTGSFSFYLSDTCRTVGLDVDGTSVVLQTEARGLSTKNSPDPESPWCQRLTPRTLDVSDADGAYSGSAHLELKIEDQTITVSGSSQAEAPANTAGYFAKGSAGFTQLDLRGGGGGVTRVRTTVSCAGSIDHAGNGVPVIGVERCNGEQICGLSVPLPGFPMEWYPGTSASFEETTDSPDDVLACLRIGFDTMAGNGGTAASSGTVVITVEPLP